MRRPLLRFAARSTATRIATKAFERRRTIKREEFEQYVATSFELGVEYADGHYLDKLRKIRAHTGYVDMTTPEVLRGLLDRIAKLADTALGINEEPET